MRLGAAPHVPGRLELDRYGRQAGGRMTQHGVDVDMKIARRRHGETQFMQARLGECRDEIRRQGQAVRIRPEVEIGPFLAQPRKVLQQWVRR